MLERSESHVPLLASPSQRPQQGPRRGGQDGRVAHVETPAPSLKCFLRREVLRTDPPSLQESERSLVLNEKLRGARTWERLAKLCRPQVRHQTEVPRFDDPRRSAVIEVNSTIGLSVEMLRYCTTSPMMEPEACSKRMCGDPSAA